MVKIKPQKKPTSLPGYAIVEQPFGIDPPNVHCPICGQPTFNTETGGYDMSPCGHLAAIYAGSIGEYAYQTPAFEARTVALDLTELAFHEFPEALAEVGYDNHLLLLEITYGGMACGPVWYTDIYAYDYNTLIQEPGKS